MGYLASLKNYFGKIGVDFDAYHCRPGARAVPLHRQGHRHFHTLFWPAMLKFSGRKMPDHVFVHGFLTVTARR
ncbi:MAG: class I tRNA ligase family protein [Minicystis sp.]